jgi:ELWxxDGT repeat protein
VNQTLFFSADDPAHSYGRELWKSDGTAAGTVLVKDINTSGEASGPYNLTNVGGSLYFTIAHWNVNGVPSFDNSSELWKSDGTAAGTVPLKNFHPSGAYGAPGSLANVHGTLLFAADDGRHGVEPWKSDGTAAGTVPLKDVNARSLSSSPGNLADVNGQTFFSADDGVHGRELWKSDGTAAGSTLLKDIYPGGTTYYYGGYLHNSSNPSNLTNVNGTLFFTADDGTGRGLWKSDGTEAGTARLSSLGRNPSNLTAVNRTLFFTEDDGVNGTELWKSDGTAAGTTMVKDIYPGSSWVYYPGGYYGWWNYVPNSSIPGNLTNVNGTLFFSAADGTTGGELWKSDGTAAGTVMVKDITPGPAGFSPGELANVNGTLFFRASDGATGAELWKSDGTAAGTVLVKDIRPGSDGSLPNHLVNVNGTLFFAANDGSNGFELWKSNGTAAGTVMVKQIDPAGDGSGSSIAPLAVVGATLYISVNDGTHGIELWRSDGTAAGTVLVKDINPGAGNTAFPSVAAVGGTLYFTAYDGASPTRLWRSDGTTTGTVLVTNLAASSLANVNGTLLFAASDAMHGQELWRLVDDASPAPSLALSGFPATVTAGVAGSVTVAVRNPDGSPNTTYRGTVHFTSSDPQAVLPADYTFTAADNGAHTFSATFKTAGGQSITVGDTILPGVTGTQAGITVRPAAASRFTVAGFPSPITAGVAGSLTVTAWDAYGNKATGYSGTVRFTSSDGQAVRPGNYTFTAADGGMHSFGAILKTAGNQSLTVMDSANVALTGVQPVWVTAAAARRLLLVAPAGVKSGVKFSLTVTVLDAYGNIVPYYRGTVTFGSSDLSAGLPKSYQFTAGDQGAHTFSGLVLKKKGKQTITVADTVDRSLTGSASIDVS